MYDAVEKERKNGERRNGGTHRAKTRQTHCQRERLCILRTRLHGGRVHPFVRVLRGVLRCATLHPPTGYRSRNASRDIVEPFIENLERSHEDYTLVRLISFK